MRTEDIKYIMEICQCGSVTKAADNLNISPQGLGKALRHLESELGCHIFERGHNGVRVTPLGTEIVEHFAKILQEENHIYRLVENSSETMGVERIILIESELSEMLINSIKKYEKESGRRYEIVFCTNEQETENDFLTGNYAYRICSRHNCINSRKYLSIPLFTMRHTPVVSKGSSLCKKSAPQWFDLDGYTILIEGNDFPYVEFLKRRLEAYGIHVVYKTPSDKLYLFSYLERHPDAVFFAAEQDIDILTERGKCTTVELDPPHEVDVILQCRSDEPDKGFVDFIKELYRN